MFFNDKGNTNIDDEFEQENILSKVLGILKKFKFIFIGIILLIVVIIIFILFFNKDGVSFNEEVTNYLDLVGDEYITLYVGSDYIEPGYNAYNSKNENLNGEVDITSDLDINVPGNYKITYTLDDIIVSRDIMVVEKPADYAYIYLMMIDNSVDIYLKLGENYVEPGYKVFSSTGKNLTNEVVVKGTVDTSKKGDYKLVYSLVDSNGVTVSAVRTVIVMDSEINLSLNIKEYTNKDVTINVGVIDNYFDYMILPDGSKINEKSTSYKVSNNGTYVFTVYNSKGMSKKSSITVNNIDRTNPTGSCTVDHNKNGSFITMNIKDSSGIKEYFYNNKKYNDSKIILNDYIDEASIVAYDKAGNSSKFNCNVLKIKEEYLVDTSHYSDLTGLNYYKYKSINISDVGCTVVNSYKNPINSMLIHEAIADDFHGILTNVCSYINDTPWISYLLSAGTYVNKEGSYHAKALAIDLNSIWTYELNGTTYMPYSSMGSVTWSRYNKFICEVCDGKEDCPYNVNYIIYKRYFEGNGWCWGGNWGISHFDPMHFEIRENNKCAGKRTQKINC